MRHTKHKPGYLLFPVLFILSCQPVVAEKMDVSVGAGLINFNYAEYDVDGRFLDGETGLIPGILLRLRQDKPKSFTELVASFYSNKIDYDGQTQGGIPLKTTSDAIVIDTHFKLASKLENDNTLYAGLGYRYWFRKIHSGQTQSGIPVAGLLEEYYWPYLLFGYQANLVKQDDYTVGVDVRFTQMISAKMNIDFLGFCGYDNTNVNLGNRNGWRFSLPIKRKFSSTSTFFITPYYEIIDIGKSNTILLTRNGSLVDCDADGYYDGALEPRSETRNLGIELTWLW